MSRVLTTSVRARWRMRVPVARVPAAMHSANVTNSRSLAASRQYHTVLVVSDHCRRSSPWNNESSSSSLSCSQRTPTVIRKRCFSKKHTKHLKIMEGDPFDVLKVSRADAYSKVKTAFLKVAMQHHPDTNAAGLSADERERSKDIFVEARKAFEAIVEDSQSGLAILKIESKDYVEEDDLDEWFRSETGYDMPFMDQATMKEVAKMTETMGGEAGLDRDGGMWTLARMVTASVKSGGDGKSILQLEAGDIRDRNINGILRRRRRW